MAILCVFFYHALYQAFGRDQLDWSGWLRDTNGPASFLDLYPITWGWCGVAIFFAVSGFCIHLSHARSRNQSTSEFHLRRWFRIYPPFLIALLLFALLFPPTRLNLHTRSGLAQFLSHLIPGAQPRQPYRTWDRRRVVEHCSRISTLHALPTAVAGARRYGWNTVLALTAVVELGMRMGCSLYALESHYSVTALLRTSPFYYGFSWTIGAVLADRYLKKEPLHLAGTSWLPWALLMIAADLFKPLEVFGFTFAWREPAAMAST